MRIFTDKSVLNEQVNGRYIFIDGDFLGQLYEHEEIFEQFVELLPSAQLIIDPYVELEFRRDVFLPKQRLLKERFVNNPLFQAVPDHQEIYKKIKANALLLSQIYAHQKENGASLVDLLLAARLMITSYESLIITGNRKDFPSCIFNNIAILNIESINGTVRSFYFIEFSSLKFNKCYELFDKLKAEEKNK